MAVLSFPGPDRSIALADLRRGKAVARRYRNRRIGEFLKELDLTEGRATGIPKILRAMRANRSPSPKFETDDDRTTFLIRLPVHPAALATGPPATGQVEAWIQATLNACNTPKSSAEIQKLVGIRHRETFQRNYLDLLIGEGLIERTIPGKPNSRLQKYRLTAKGRAWLQQIARA